MYVKKDRSECSSAFEHNKSVTNRVGLSDKWQEIGYSWIG